MTDLEKELLKAGLSLLIALITLGLGWLVGHLLTFRWNLLQKRRETDIALLQQFYSLYGEAKEVSKTWRVIIQGKALDIKEPPDSRWRLLARACAVEGKNEAIMVKLATERRLKEDALTTLGLFRQAIQQLRESIHDNEGVPWASRRESEYDYFNYLATKVAEIISSPSRAAYSRPESASQQLKAVAGIRGPDFDTAKKRFEETYPEHTQD